MYLQCAFKAPLNQFRYKQFVFSTAYRVKNIYIKLMFMYIFLLTLHCTYTSMNLYQFLLFSVYESQNRSQRDPT